MTRALFIGRFQPLHRGHLHALTSASQDHDLIIGIGSAQYSHTDENPLTLEERKRLLQNCLDDPETIAIPDQHDDEAWMDWIEDHLSIDLCISGNDHVRELFSQRGYDITHPEYLRPDHISGTTIRERIRDGQDWHGLVPDCSLNILHEIGFEDRIRDS